MTKAIVVDTAVIVDILVSTRQRHTQAARLRDYLERRSIGLRVPVHAILEVWSAIGQEKASQLASRRPHAMNRAVNKEHPLRISTVPIDDRFLKTYFDPTMPRIRAGDYPFVAIAKHERLDLVTEDVEMLRAARAAGVAVYTIGEYLLSVGVDAAGD